MPPLFILNIYMLRSLYYYDARQWEAKPQELRENLYNIHTAQPAVYPQPHPRLKQLHRAI